MPTITRTQIKQVENGMRLRAGINPATLKGLGFPLPTSPPSSSPPIAGTSTNQSISFQQFWQLLTGQIGTLKIEATQFVEGMVRIMYGLEPDMRMPSPGIQVIPNNQTPSFAAGSIAGMIERCRLTEAQSALNSMNSEFNSRMANASDPLAPYIKRWWDQYGRNDLSNLTTKIVSGRGTCGLIGEIPKVCTAPQTWCSSQLRCAPPGECTSSTGISTTMLVGIAAVVGLMMFMKR